MHIVEENTLKVRALEKIKFVPNKRRGVYMRLYGTQIVRLRDSLRGYITVTEEGRRRGKEGEEEGGVGEEEGRRRRRGGGGKEEGGGGR